MKVIGLWAILLIMCYALQTSLLPLLSFDGFSANLMILLTSSVAYLCGHKKGVFFGFVAGLLQDLTAGSYFGLATFSYMTIGLIFGKCSVNLFRDQSILPVISAIPALAVHFSITIIFLLMLGHHVDFMRFMKYDFWPAAITQVLLAYPVHRLVHAVNRYAKEHR